MKLSVAIMKTLFPERERERMEMRACIGRAQAEAEDLEKTIKVVFNGHLKDIEWPPKSYSSLP